MIQGKVILLLKIDLPPEDPEVYKKTSIDENSNKEAYLKLLRLYSKSGNAMMVDFHLFLG